ncbi:hypothetical protein [Hydrogenophaga sp. PAMC20947]|uniref:thermonuclease family protein n=1 Tax=Hydrogenophaga sp. PAMC20947 TaxID=2565558 RepID=UPI00109DF433|nr:hypothetical protein [Hydrogenophaga sp. PAMC20947]QCB46618.1 hypothetical protein E5678_11640 [Hydrogenophaga sp. PAMC20947]
MIKQFFTLKLLMAVISALPLATSAAGVEDSLPANELLIGENFERGINQDPSARTYMLEFSDPKFLSHTSKLRKVWGRAKVLDGETLVVRGEKIHLRGIKAPDISETCKERVLDIQFDAGAYSLQRLKRLAANSKAVICYVENMEGNPGTCFIWGLPGPINLARLQVRSGAAWASPVGSSTYARDEDFASGNLNPSEKNIWHTECRRPSN